MLGDQQGRAHRAHQGGHRGADRAHPPVGRGAGGQGDVDRGARGGGPAGVLHESGAREQPLAGLVDGQGDRARLVPQRTLHAVAMVDVDIDVHHPLLARLQSAADREGGVVIDAEP